MNQIFTISKRPSLPVGEAPNNVLKSIAPDIAVGA
jgi:hypothetical protein